MTSDPCEVTLFTAPRAFEGSVGVSQRRAIESWRRLGPACEILLLGDEVGMADVARDLGVRHITDINRNEFGTPLVDSIFGMAEREARGRLLCYINADIILTQSFLRSIALVEHDRFLMIGRRWDIDPVYVPDLDRVDWETAMSNNIAAFGRLHEPTGIDYFIHTPGLWPSIPPFALGRWVWDNWLVYAARASRAPVIDATSAIEAIHQNHGYGHHAGDNDDPLDKPEARRNLALAGGYRYTFNIADASHALQRGAVVRRGIRGQEPAQLARRVSALYPRLGLPVRVALRLSRVFARSL